MRRARQEFELCSPIPLFLLIYVTSTVLRIDTNLPYSDLASFFFFFFLPNIFGKNENRSECLALNFVIFNLKFILVNFSLSIVSEKSGRKR